MDESLKAIIQLYKRLHPLKELPRTGWILEGAPRHESDSVAAHSHLVVIVGYLTARALGSRPAFPSLNMEKVLSMAALHDIAESVTGELPSVFKRFLSREQRDLFDELEKKALNVILADVPGKDDISVLLAEYGDCRTPEAKVVKFADIFDAFAQARVVLRRTFPVYLEKSEAKLRAFSPAEDGGIGNLLADWILDIKKDWDSVERKVIA